MSACAGASQPAHQVACSSSKWRSVWVDGAIPGGYHKTHRHHPPTTPTNSTYSSTTRLASATIKLGRHNAALTECAWTYFAKLVVASACVESAYHLSAVPYGAVRLCVRAYARSSIQMRMRPANRSVGQNDEVIKGFIGNPGRQTGRQAGPRGDTCLPAHAAHDVMPYQPTNQPTMLTPCFSRSKASKSRSSKVFKSSSGPG